jgi:pyruvate/2-oxoglutarate dehydrogenase complex dihydrolipoamide acyltransferase (E2) component
LYTVTGVQIGLQFDLNAINCIILGGVAKKPVVIDDEIVIRRIMSLSIVMDHRMVDASHGGKLLRYLRRMFKEPELLES